MTINGTLLSYYLICQRKLYLYAHNIKCEDNSELVKIGKYLHKERQLKFKETKEEAEILIDSVKIDSIEGDYVIEYKKKNSDEKAAIAQLLFYLFTLKQKGIIKKGILKFKESRSDVLVELTEENENYIKDLIQKVEKIIVSETIPDVINKPKCKKCAYYDYCYS